MKLFLLYILFPVVTVCYGNDGAFKVAGNQLIPMYETDISVQKEILTIKRINESQAQITVYYEFFNPGEDKELEVGFEATSPSGDVDPTPVAGRHPYITKFTVNMNEAALPFKVAIVDDSLYYKNGKYKSKPLDRVMKQAESEMEVDFFYVYHFRARFKKGINIIKHTYVVDLSGSVMERYFLEYVLTAATRWANRQIDDFTLHIDMGTFQDISIPATFFGLASEWQLTGSGKSITHKKNKEEKDALDTAQFFTRKGELVFKKNNFKPRSELQIHAFNAYFNMYQADSNPEVFDSKRNNLPFSIEDQEMINKPADAFSKKILKNLPYARRGYVFKSPDLQAWFSRQPWYIADETYVPALDKLTKKEQDWLLTL